MTLSLTAQPTIVAREITSAAAALLRGVDQFNQIARDALAEGNMMLVVRAITISAQYLQAAREMQRMHDAS